MKIFQILNDFCYWDATSLHPTLESTVGRYAPDIIFIEAPDFVFEGWGYMDGEFIKPSSPEPAEWTDEETGAVYHWQYDDSTGTWYVADENNVPVEPLTLEAALEALKDAQEALALAGIEREVVENE